MDTKSSHTQTSYDAISLLEQDHEHVKRLFKEYEKLGTKDADQKAELVAEACQQLTIHAALEEELFYPAIRTAVKSAELDEAEVEHAQARALVEQLESMEPGDALYDATVTVLGEYVAHHVKEEEGAMFPAVRKSSIDLATLGKEIMERRKSLLAETESGSGSSSRKTRKGPPTQHARH